MAYDPNARQVSRINKGAPAEYTEPAQMAPSFGGMSPAVAREVATIQGQIMLAKMFPRDMAEVTRKVEASCSRKQLASHALYQYARGGTDISGPSIRLAEALINAYGNAKSGFEVIDSNPDFSRVRAYAYDMETNTIQERTFDVEHVRQTKTGRTKLTDPRDIYETVANNASRRERACILALIPGDLVEFAVKTCRETLEKNVNITPKRIEELVESFSKYGVSRVMIEARIQRHMNAVTATQFIDLLNIGTSLRDGIATVDDFFDRNAKPIGENAAAEKPAEREKAVAKKAAAEVQQGRKPEEPQMKEKEPEASVPDIPDEVWNDSGEKGVTSEGEIIDDGLNGPESFADDDWEGFEYDR